MQWLKFEDYLYMKCGTHLTKGRTCKSDKINDDARPFYNILQPCKLRRNSVVCLRPLRRAMLSIDGFFFSKFVAVSMVDILEARSRKWNWVHHCISLYPADVSYVNYRPMQD